MRARTMPKTMPARSQLLLTPAPGVVRLRSETSVLTGVSYGIPGGGTRRIVACSKAHAYSISRGSLHAIPAKLTPNGRGFGSKPSGIGGSGSVWAKANGTMTIG